MVTSKAVVVATGVTAQGRREILGLDVGDSEDEVFWRGFLTGLKKRGLGGVKLVISDQHAGLVAAISRAMQGSSHQRCRVHFIRNVLAHVAKGEGEMVAAVFRTIFAQPDLTSMSKQWDKVQGELVPARYPKIGTLMDTPRPRSSPSPLSPASTGARSGPPTPSSGSTRRSNAAPASWASSPTKPP
jgi:putative transposase